MVKRTLLTLTVCLAATALFWAYFHYVGELSLTGRKGCVCNGVNIILTGSESDRSVNLNELEGILRSRAVGRNTDSIDLLSIEMELQQMGEVLAAEAFASSPDSISVCITQRKPVVRFVMEDGSYYSDENCFLFPARNPARIPVVTGKIPIKLEPGYKGHPSYESYIWTKRMIGLAQSIENDSFLRNNIQQIDVEGNGSLVMYPDLGDCRFIFGQCEGIPEKLEKIKVYYKGIAPVKDAGYYRTVDIEYKNQIICRQK
ncbi:MAG: hypothetical protein KBT00_00190 [Bacteroidales bacterium]|nr:hypothetical protein [Candidatus Cacconaster merdequi]